MQPLTLAGVTLLAATLLTGCGADSGPTGETAPAGPAYAAMPVTHSSSVTPLDYIFVSPCNGEDIHMIGTLRSEDTFLGTGDGVHYELQVVTSETGTGLTTGATYRSVDVNHESWTAPTPVADFRSYFFTEIFYFISPTPGLSFRSQNLFHFVEQPSGAFKITKDIGSLECKG